MSKKYENCEVKIDTLIFPNKGIGMWENNRVEVKNTIPGQTVCADVKKKRGKYEGRLKSILKRAPYEGESTCDSFEICGGCAYRTISYEKELEFKKAKCVKAFKRRGY